MVMDADAMRRAWARVAHEILERNGSEDELVLAGIRTRGVPLAHRLSALINEFGGHGRVLDLPVDRHRDDRVSHAAAPQSGGASGEVVDRLVILIDDVIFHGRTARAALDALTELGRPKAVPLAVMVDRGHRELPIKADFVGKNIPTHLTDRVHVRLNEVDGDDAVLVTKNVG